MAHILIRKLSRQAQNSARKKETEQVTQETAFLTSRDVAYLLDCSPDEVVNLARQGQLPAVKQGRFWRFRRSDVMVYKRPQKKVHEQLEKIA